MMRLFHPEVLSLLKKDSFADVGFFTTTGSIVWLNENWPDWMLFHIPTDGLIFPGLKNGLKSLACPV
jgi:hypothetical protein